MAAAGVATRRLALGTPLLVTVALASVAAYVVVALQRIGYPYELTYFEGSTVEVSARVAAGEPIYGPPSTEFVPWPYPPLYFWVTGAVMRFTGVDLTPMRVVSFGASLAVLVLLALVVRRAGGSTVAGLVAAGLFAATYRVSGAFFDVGRVDSLFLALVLAAILVGMRARTWRGGVALGVVLVSAFLTKQNALVVAAPILLWLLWRRRPVGVSAVVTVVVGVVGSTLVGNLVTDGWYARYVLAQLPSQGWELHWLYDFWWRDLLQPFAVSLVVVVLVARGLSMGGIRRYAAHDVGGYLLASAVGLVVAAWVSRLHEGGYANVAMPAHVALCGALGLVLAAGLRRSRGAPEWVAAVLAVQVVVMALWQLNLVPSQSDREAGDRFVATLRDLPGAALVPTHPYYLRLAGLPAHASSIAIDDLYRAAGGPQALAGVVPWGLDGVSAVVLDNTTDVRLFGDVLTRDFTLVTTAVVPEDVFVPVTDLPTHPALLYVRTSELSRVTVSPPR